MSSEQTTSNELKDRMARLLIDEIGPALGLDGSGIKVLAIVRGVAQVKLGNVCSTCPSTIMAVIMGLEQEVRKRLPEIDYIEAVP